MKISKKIFFAAFLLCTTMEVKAESVNNAPIPPGAETTVPVREETPLPTVPLQGGQPTGPVTQAPPGASVTPPPPLAGGETHDPTHPAQSFRATAPPQQQFNEELTDDLVKVLKETFPAISIRSLKAKFKGMGQALKQPKNPNALAFLGVKIAKLLGTLNIEKIREIANRAVDLGTADESILNNLITVAAKKIVGETVDSSFDVFMAAFDAENEKVENSNRRFYELLDLFKKATTLEEKEKLKQELVANYDRDSLPSFLFDFNTKQDPNTETLFRMMTPPKTKEDEPDALHFTVTSKEQNTPPRHSTLTWDPSTTRKNLANIAKTHSEEDFHWDPTPQNNVQYRPYDPTQKAPGETAPPQKPKSEPGPDEAKSGEEAKVKRDFEKAKKSVKESFPALREKAGEKGLINTSLQEILNPETKETNHTLILWRNARFAYNQFKNIRDACLSVIHGNKEQEALTARIVEINTDLTKFDKAYEEFGTSNAIDNSRREKAKQINTLFKSLYEKIQTLEPCFDSNKVDLNKVPKPTDSRFEKEYRKRYAQAVLNLIPMNLSPTKNYNTFSPVLKEIDASLAPLENLISACNDKGEITALYVMSRDTLMGLVETYKKKARNLRTKAKESLDDAKMKALKKDINDLVVEIGRVAPVLQLHRKECPTL